MVSMGSLFAEKHASFQICPAWVWLEMICNVGLRRPHKLPEKSTPKPRSLHWFLRAVFSTISSEGGPYKGRRTVRRSLGMGKCAVASELTPSPTQWQYQNMGLPCGHLSPLRRIPSSVSLFSRSRKRSAGHEAGCIRSHLDAGSVGLGLPRQLG